MKITENFKAEFQEIVIFKKYFLPALNFYSPIDQWRLLQNFPDHNHIIIDTGTHIHQL